MKALYGNSLAIVLWITIMMFGWVKPAFSCPDGCLCKTLSIICYNIDHLGDLPNWSQNVTIKGSLTTLALFPSLNFTVSHLDISHNEISDIPRNSFQGLSNLSSLDLHSNKISILYPESLSGLYNLKYLDLSYNQISSIPEKIFHDTNYLQILKLGNNSIRFLPSDLFWPLNQIKGIDLSWNSLTFLPLGIVANRSSLQVFDLRFNSLRTFQSKLLMSFMRLDKILLENNPIDCSCVIHLLLNLSKENPEKFPDFETVLCSFPEHLKGQRLPSLFSNTLICSNPVIDYISSNLSTISHKDVRLDCNATGHPAPSIVWITPWGDSFTHDSHLHLLMDHEEVMMQRTYTDTKFTSKIFVSMNGSLHIRNVRGYFGGSFKCLSVNLVGNYSSTLELTLYSFIPSVYIMSLIISSSSAAGFLIVGILYGLTKMLVMFVRRRMRDKKIKDEDIIEPRKLMNTADIENINDDIYNSPFGSILYLDQSPRPSPKKCTTPIGEPDEKWSPDFQNIFETLDEVRTRLRFGVERKMERVRCQVQSIRDSGTHYMHNIRESGNHYVQTIKESGSYAANRVRAGVVLGVEQVKYHVQSIKEFCGTGDMGGQTVSMISISTDVDTQHRTEIVRSHTFV